MKLWLLKWKLHQNVSVMMNSIEPQIAKLLGDQIIVDMREGRKFQVDIVLPPIFIWFLTNYVGVNQSVYILDKGNADTTRQICSTFGLTSQDEILQFKSNT